ncbi:MAG: LysR family transcriptional regulator [Burkholderiales bacterium]|nr:LysR family transcriptional regulator [Burkholderiales bacterium]
MHATFRQLRLMLALADTGSVSAAARACHVSQPTVSMQLKALAESVGLPLYEQRGRRLHLTAMGEALARRARNMSNEWAAFEQEVAAEKGLTRGRLRLSIASTAKYFVPRMLGTFCARYPDIDIELQVLNRDGVVERLRNHRDDLYIMSMPPVDMALEQRMFLANPLVVVAPLHHGLAGRGSIGLPRLARERFILRERGSGTRLACDAHFAALGFRPTVRLELGSNEAIRHAVAADLGLAVLLMHAIGPAEASARVAVLKVRGFPVQSSWFVIHPKGKRLSPIAAEFSAHLQATAGAG